MAEEIYFTGRFVRDHIKTHGPSSPYDMWKILKAIRENKGYKVPSYQSFYQNYIWKPKKIGLLEKVEEEEKDYTFDKALYDIPDGMEDSPCWNHPEVCYNILTELGTEDYGDLKYEAGMAGVSPIRYFIHEYPDRIEEIAEERGMSAEELKKELLTRDKVNIKVEKE